MAVRKKISKKATRRKPKSTRSSEYTLPTERRVAINDIWRYAFLISGQKKIGKTSFAIEGAEEFVIQFDKPQLSYNIREECPKTWPEFMRVLKALEKAAASNTFVYNRVVIDGVGEWYSICQTEVCKEFGVEHPSDVGYAKAWHKLRDYFTDAMNRLLRLQIDANCGLIFISHAEWKEVKTKDEGKLERLAPEMGGKCESIVGGKVDGWFMYDYVGENRVMIVQGTEAIAAGHRIDGRFLTIDGRRVKEIPMGDSAADALENFTKGFNNQLEYVSFKEQRDALRKTKTGKETGTARGRRKKVVKR